MLLRGLSTTGRAEYPSSCWKATTNMYQPGIDVNQAELHPHLTCWRRQEKTEMHHVSVRVRSRRVPRAMDEELFATEEFDGGDEDYGGLLIEEEKQRLESDTILATCLVEFYGKCGGMRVAEDLFESIHPGDLTAWNAFLSGFSSRGDARGVRGAQGAGILQELHPPAECV